MSRMSLAVEMLDLAGPWVSSDGVEELSWKGLIRQPEAPRPFNTVETQIQMERLSQTVVRQFIFREFRVLVFLKSSNQLAMSSDATRLRLVCGGVALATVLGSFSDPRQLLGMNNHSLSDWLN